MLIVVLGNVGYMDLSIIIVNWNTRNLLQLCLDSLWATADRANYLGSMFGTYTTETFVVDNASTDGSARMITESYPWVHLIVNEQNVGFAPANNQAFRQSTSRYALLLNSDTIVHAGAIQALIKFMDDYPQCGAGGAQLLNADGSLQPSCQPMLTPWREFWRLTFLDRIWQHATYNMRKWNAASPRQVETIKGACLIVRQAALHAGDPLLDEQYFMYTEEVDLCYRLTQDRWELYWIPQACVTHFGEASSKQAYNQMYVQLYRSKVQFYRKFGGTQRAYRFKQLVKAAYIPRLIAAKLLSRLRPAYAARATTFSQLLAELPKM
jgi:GT2 family glycosyltransferase